MEDWSYIEVENDDLQKFLDDGWELY